MPKKEFSFGLTAVGIHPHHMMLLMVSFSLLARILCFTEFNDGGVAILEENCLNIDFSSHFLYFCFVLFFFLFPIRDFHWSCILNGAL